MTRGSALAHFTTARQHVLRVAERAEAELPAPPGKALKLQRPVAASEGGL
jgi:hypothetical protein